jgi:catechol 2,3-dioxygenase-like lactoylglutathione lyase family enzyme
MQLSTRLRQIALATNNIDAVASTLTSELGLEVAHRDPWVAMFGLQNVVMPIGDRDFLEVVSPVAEETSAGRYLDRNGGDGGYMLIFETADVDALRPEIDALGVRIVQAVEGEQHTSLQLHPKDCNGIMLSVDSASDDWLAAGPEWPQFVRTGIVTGIAAIEFAVDEPASVAQRWARLTGAFVDGANGDTVRCTNLLVRLVPPTDGRAGLRAIHLVRGPACRYQHGDTRRICGVEFVFTDAKEAAGV